MNKHIHKLSVFRVLTFVVTALFLIAVDSLFPVYAEYNCHSPFGNPGDTRVVSNRHYTCYPDGIWHFDGYAR